jgi:hypothetical protein
LILSHEIYADYILNVKLRLPGSALSRGNCDIEIFIPVDRAFGGSIERKMRGMR